MVSFYLYKTNKCSNMSEPMRAALHHTRVLFRYREMKKNPRRTGNCVDQNS